jgi:hypothetical protein
VGLNDRLRCLERLEPAEPRRPRSPEHVYDRIRREATESIEKSLREGDEPLYRIVDNGDVETADGRSIGHYGHFIRALDDHIRALEEYIAGLEREEVVIEDGWREHGP